MAEDILGEGLAMKPTTILTNMPSIASGVNYWCTGGHKHVHLVSGKAKGAAKYTYEFCRAIVDGIATYYGRSKGVLRGDGGLNPRNGFGPRHVRARGEHTIRL